jgi:hypothetical protein
LRDSILGPVRESLHIGGLNPIAAALLIPSEIHSGADLFSKSSVWAIAGGKVLNSSEQ